MIEIIPAIDIIDGKCVRLSQGDYNTKTIYNENPLEVAKQFEDAGIHRVHLVDLDGAKAKHVINHKVLEDIATHTSLVIDFGGGIQSDEDIDIAFAAGAAMVTGGSVAAKNRKLFVSWVNKYGGDKIILGADSKNNQIAVSGWQEATSLAVVPYISNYIQYGVQKVVCTDISKDGMLGGPAVELYKKILEHIPGVYLIASGGVSCKQDILNLEAAGVPAIIMGKAIYENKITLKELAELQDR
ncbi:1-(5-phosphoribosyl)-5-[(5-phosphoribosylamino)methylideneamino]imidazole-4-carboxamide isomerase [Dysgonomonas macrotermitis]|uniref:1-(5-phosphoribosyl)-5-[(5-phosphoribosylamino)methylideneamino] imidazole-4-carboxamide isomerase n=1 Tax=Dysgonomonas macrotermitis TaxID=1346286 RepID=A0A1M5AP02_9BACT|nr:1-(5-phosphoribosyl)-5-[(5-phosphoribosylamino)methylideneamino]imidazole-4-carboxamide isomerase [Dysgonomonas macrotermitis]SHF31896.1 1-(5-phosphoribosyl)-5-[(5-phosphoribosylamino)methylideneamino] imidazole-4-carboxamide isomerase [Dysgonomonas macrotermitis]